MSGADRGGPERVKRVVVLAIALPAEEREGFIVSECAGDAELEREVRSLVAAHEAAGSFMGSPTARGEDGPGVGVTAAGPAREGPGARIGPYRLLELIGEGGFGSVYMAEQREPIARRVALKIIKPGMDSRMVAARFEAERQALALMEHPHIARVFDAGVTDVSQGSRPYFVMEYVKGDPITAFADAHKLSLAERLGLFAQVCEAVQHAHTKGVIHRDLKPGNVLVCMTDGRPFAKVIDFGIAKATGAAGGRLTDKTLFTEHRQLIGTPEYMSPEQAEGSPDIDTRTDVYALGVLLYELLTGSTPFDAARLRSAAFAEMQRIIREEDPPAPSVKLSRDLKGLAAAAMARQAEPGRLGGQVRGELDWIVMKALEKERGRRYESASALAGDVRRHLAGEAVVAAPASAGYRVRKFVRRNRGAVVTGGAVVGALMLGVAGTGWGMMAARAEAEKNSRAAERTRAVLRELVQDIRGIAPDGEDPPEVAAGLAAAPENFEVQLEGIRHGAAVLLGYIHGQNFKLRAQVDAVRDVLTRIVSADMASTGATGMSFTITEGVSTIVPIVDPDSKLSFLRTTPIDGTRSQVGRVDDSEMVPLLGVLMERATARLREQVEVTQRQSREIQRSLYTHTVQEAFTNWENARFEAARELLEECPEEFRGWEWEFVHGLTDVREFVLDAHEGVVTALAFTGRTGMLASAGEDGRVRIWDCENDPTRAMVEIVGHPAPVRAMAFTTDDRLLLTVCGDDAVRVWDAAGGGLVRELRHSGAALGTLAVGKDGGWCAAAGEDGVIRMWNPATGARLHDLEGHGAAVGALCASPMGDLLVSGDADGWVMMWDAVSGRRVEEGTVRPGGGRPFPIECLAFGEDWSVLVGASHRGDIFNPEVAPTALGLPGITETRWRIIASDDRGDILAGRPAGSGYTWAGNSGTPDPVLNWQGEAEPPSRPTVSRGVAVSADARWTAVGWDDGSIEVSRGWHGYVPSPLRMVWKELPLDVDSLMSAEVAGDALVLTSSGRSVVAPLDPASAWSGTVLHVDAVIAVAGDGSVCLARGQGSEVEVLDLRSGERIGGWLGGGGRAALSRDGAETIEASGREVRVRRTRSGEVLRTIGIDLPESTTIRVLKLSPDGRLVGIGTEQRGEPGEKFGDNISGGVGVVELASGRLLWHSDGMRPMVFGGNTLHPAVDLLEFDPSSSRLVVSGGSAMSLWGAQDGAALGSARVTRVSDLCFAPDGERIFTVQTAAAWGRPSTLGVWSTADLRRVLAWSCGDAGSVCVSPDGRHLLLTGVSLWVSPIGTDRGMAGLERGLFRLRGIAEAVNELSRRAASVEEVVAAIVASGAFSDGQKRLAGGLVSPGRVWERGSAALKVVTQADLPAERYAAALVDAAFAASAMPGDSEVLRTLGMALYRVGRWGEAAGALSQADELFIQSGQWAAGVGADGPVGRPSCVAFLAMAQDRAGDIGAAGESLERLRRLAEAPRWRGNREVEAYLAEAAAVIGAGTAR